MAIERDRPYTGANFLVDLGDGDSDGPRRGFTRVEMPSGELEYVSYRQGNDRIREQKVAPRVVNEPVLLERPYAGALDLYDWWNQARNGAQVRRNVRVQLLSEDMGDVVLAVRLLNAVPLRYGLSGFDAGDEQLVLETLALAYERFELE
jgi:phage tail-like protein